LSPFDMYDNYVMDQARQYFKPDKNGRLPSIHHLLLVKAKLVYRPDPKPHYIIALRYNNDDGTQASPLALTIEQQKMMLDAWEGSMKQYMDAVRNYDGEASADAEVPF